MRAARVSKTIQIASNDGIEEKKRKPDTNTNRDGIISEYYTHLNVI